MFQGFSAPTPATHAIRALINVAGKGSGWGSFSLVMLKVSFLKPKTSSIVACIGPVLSRSERFYKLIFVLNVQRAKVRFQVYPTHHPKRCMVEGKTLSSNNKSRRQTGSVSK
jgi:hypothetical protein